MQKTALISVSDKTGVVKFARSLSEIDWQIVSTGGTFKVLMEAKIPVLAVEDITNIKEAMGGRLKTIHPKIAGGILARRDNPEDMRELFEVINSRTFDLVAVNLYPFAATAAKSDVTAHELIENIDIGGPSLIRAAAKNFRDVFVLVDPSDYTLALEHVVNPDIFWWYSSLRCRREMAIKAFEYTAGYDAVIAREFPRIKVGNSNELTLVD